MLVNLSGKVDQMINLPLQSWNISSTPMVSILPISPGIDSLFVTKPFGRFVVISIHGSNDSFEAQPNR